MRHFRESLKLALLKLKQKYLSLTFRQRRTRSKRNTSVDNGHAKKNRRLRRNGPNVNTLFFETTVEAVARVGKRKRQEEGGERKKKRHSPPPNQVNFDKENLLKEVTNIKDGEKVSLLSVL